MIDVLGVRKVYANGSPALKGINMTLNEGEFAVLLGPSGAGKSTLLRCVNGLVEPSEGQILIDGLPMGSGRSAAPLRKQTGMIFQQFNLVKRLNVLENVLCGRLGVCHPIFSCMKRFSRDDMDQAWSCLEKVGMADKANCRADTLSGGQQQRVGIARALAQNPRVLLCDEPVASLDPRSTERIMSILADLNRNDGKTLVVSLHNVELARAYGHRIIGMNDGRVVVDRSASILSLADTELIYGKEDQEESVMIPFPVKRLAYA